MITSAILIHIQLKYKVKSLKVFLIKLYCFSSCNVLYREIIPMKIHPLRADFEFYSRQEININHAANQEEEIA